MTLKGYIALCLVTAMFVSLTSCGQRTLKSKNAEDSMNEHTNALINESSPYLLQHAHNPVDWRPWNKETLEMARKQDKPMIVSIGYAACHWCHVMEHESFEDSAVAAVMNEHFICVKVDREERPDVDQYYMSAINLMTGRGGWPLNCFTLPNGTPFHAGTYFRKEDWLRLLHAVSNEFQTNRKKLEEFGEKLENGIATSQQLDFGDGSQQDLEGELHKTVMTWIPNFDTVNGGANRAPKFPLPSNMDFLLRYGDHYGHEPTLQHVYRTLDAMADGGIYDQVGGGFARYSVDELWKVPHFEKMLYDNAQLISLYCDAYRQSDNPRYVQIARETADFCLRELKGNSDMFYSSLDADSEGEEGLFYTWTQKQIEQTVGEDMDFARLYFKLDKRAVWEDRLILMRNVDKAGILEEMSFSEDAYESKRREVLIKLMNVRKERIRPGLDDKCLTSWNGMMVTALLDLFQVTEQEEYKTAAIETLDFILEHQLNEGVLNHSYKNEKSSIKGFLEDYAFIIDALIKANSVTGNVGYLETAHKLGTYVIDNFYDKEAKVFAFTDHASNELGVAPVEIMDNVIPASNSVMARNCYKLYMIQGDETYYQIYHDLAMRIAPKMKSYGSGYSNWAQLVMDEIGPSYELVVIGLNAPVKAVQLSQRYLPNALVVCTTEPSDLSLFQDRWKEGATMIYECQDRACKLPVEEVNDVEAGQ